MQPLITLPFFAGNRKEKEMSEKQRLAALYRYQILDTLPEVSFDDITALASEICGTPIALVSLIDKSRQWIKSAHGISPFEIKRNLTFCDYAIRQDHLFLVPDTLKDDRFSSNPAVINDPNIRFYAGAPLVAPGDQRIGTLCVLSNEPRVLTQIQEMALKRLSRQVIQLMEARVQAQEQIHLSAGLSMLSSVALSVNQSSRPEESFRTCIREICHYTGWKVGKFRLKNSEQINADATSHLFLEKVRELEFSGIINSLSEKVTTTKEPEWVEHLPKTFFPLKSALVIPVMVKDQKASELQFFSDAVIRPDRRLLEILSQLGHQMGRVLERAFTDEALQEMTIQLEKRVKDRTEQLEISIQKHKASENRFRALLEQSFFPTQVYDTHGKMTKYNRAAQEFWGTPDIPLSHLYKDVLSQKLGLSSYLDQVFKIKQRVMTHAFCYEGNLGRCQWMEAFFSPVKDQNQNIVEVILILRDVTSEKEAQDQIRSKQDELQAILDHCPAVIVMEDYDGRILLANREFERIFRFDRSKDLGKSVYDVIPLDLAKKFRKNTLQVFQSGAVIQGEEEFEIGGVIHTHLTVRFPVRDSGKLKGVCVVATDVTEHKRVERDHLALQIRERSAHEASRLKSEFLANISHEVRTPLNGVIGLTDLLLTTPLNAEQIEYVTATKTSGATLLAIINDILNFSKIEAGKIEFEQVDFDLPQLMEDSLKALYFISKSKGIELKKEILAHRSLGVQGDPTRLKQVILNLTNNAIKFTHEGSVTVRVKELDRDSDHINLRFEVEDTGIGIAEQSLNRLFLAFSQVDASTHRQYGGTGLGLSICKKLIEAMGGSVGVKSKEGLGSLFFFELKFRLGQTLPSNVTPVLSLIAPNQKIRKVLVVEDNPVNQMVTVKMLEKMGVQVELAADGYEAIDRLNKNQYDLVLMDCHMPGMDGYDTTRRIRESKGVQPVIVAMTANALPGEKEKCLQAGMNGYLSKPMEFEKLREAITRYLDRKRAA